jgi:site-specific recombinase XerD
VRHQYLSATPFAPLHLPAVENRVSHPLEPDEWEQLLLACHPPKETGVIADQAAARNRAILWVLFETGMYTTEVCRLRLADVDREQGTLSVREKGSTVRRLTLGREGWSHLLAYLDAYRLKGTTHCEQERAHSEPLFLSDTGHPLTKGTIALLFSRLSERVEVRRKKISPSLLRESFVIRYLQTGGTPGALLDVPGLKEIPSFTSSVMKSNEGGEDQK